jgi:type II restriction enzyme
MKLTAEDIVRAIHHLPKNRVYHYPNPVTRTVIEIADVILPEGPIHIRRYNPEEGETSATAETQSISSQMIWRVANAFSQNQPVNIDRVLGASYNTRSALEALLAHTPQFYMCYPGRIENIKSSVDIKSGHKHLLWLADLPHQAGEVVTKETKVVISEIPNQEVMYDALSFPDDILQQGLDINIQRRHAQIQIALINIGQHLGYKTWVAQNDRGIIYKQKRLGEMENVLPSLRESTLISSWDEAIRAALLIDCIWFKNGRLMPAVMEVEHTTGVTSGLTRMKKLQDAIPSVLTRYVIVAPDEDRQKVITEINQEQFHSLNAKYFPYSAVEELWALCERRKIKGITEEFLDCYMEPVLIN